MSIFNSIPGLANVCFIFVLMCVMFGIFGVQLWAGALDYRCRLVPEPISLPSSLVKVYREAQYQFNSPYTPDPIKQEWFINFLTNRTAFPYCGIPLSNVNWNQITSPWVTPQDCAWPVDNGQNYMINNITYGIDSDAYGNCSPIPGVGRNCPFNGICGSNFDDYGNGRFSDSFILNEGSYTFNLNYGYTNFNDLLSTTITIFEVITTSGWSDVMLQMENFSYFWLSDLFFMMFVFLGAFLLMNLVFAVIWDNFDQPEAATTSLSREMERELLEKKATELAAQGSKRRRSTVVTRGLSIFQSIADSNLFSGFIILCIVINSVVLALDDYPLDPVKSYRLEVINCILTLIFTLEMIIKMIGKLFTIRYIFLK